MAVLLLASLVLTYGGYPLQARRFTGSTNLDAVLDSRTVYMCGYKFLTFCQTVFPEYSCSTEIPPIGNEKAGDILLVGMHASCERAETFTSPVLYINGEPERARQVHDSFYLGPVTEKSAAGEPKSKQFYFVQIAALKIPEAFPAFIKRPRNSREGFLLYVSRRCLVHRENAFNLFSRLAPVTAGGRCNGSTNMREQGHALSIQAHGSWSDAHQFYRKFKFGLVMENTKLSGYVSEKILNAFIGGTVPIYYGTEDVFKIFNRKAFIFYDAANPTATLEEVSRLLQDDAAYDKIASQPILAEGAYDKFFAFLPRGQTVAEIREFLGLRKMLDDE